MVPALLKACSFMRIEVGVVCGAWAGSKDRCKDLQGLAVLCAVVCVWLPLLAMVWRVTRE